MSIADILANTAARHTPTPRVMADAEWRRRHGDVSAPASSAEKKKRLSFANRRDIVRERDVLRAQVLGEGFLGRAIPVDQHHGAGRQRFDEGRHLHPVIERELRPRLEEARLDTLALIRTLDQLQLPKGCLPDFELSDLYELDADCAEALWALDQPERSLDFQAMYRDTLESLASLPSARADVREALSAPYRTQWEQVESEIRAALTPADSYSGL